MSPQLTAKNLGKVYGQSVALKSVDLKITAGEFVCVIGPNGSGKSTLLKLIAGIETPTSGNLTVATESSYVPQRPSLLPWRTVAGNLELPAGVRGLDPDQAEIKRWLREFDLMAFANAYPATLSGGMQQKVALIRAVLYSPSLLLMDEPFAALDAITRLELQSWLLRLQQKTRATVVCVTHDIREAVFLADTVYVLSPRPGHIRRRFSVKHPPSGRSRTASYIRRLEASLARLVAATP
jgi:NitT/TauT family transport system ATP-binding protein